MSSELPPKQGLDSFLRVSFSNFTCPVGSAVRLSRLSKDQQGEVVNGYLFIAGQGGVRYSLGIYWA